MKFSHNEIVAAVDHIEHKASEPLELPKMVFYDHVPEETRVQMRAAFAAEWKEYLERTQKAVVEQILESMPVGRGGTVREAWDDFKVKREAWKKRKGLTPRELPAAEQAGED